MLNKKNYCFYLSDHGFGHIARNISIICSVVHKTEGMVYVVCGKKQIDFAKDNLQGLLSSSDFSRIRFRASQKMDIGLILKEGTLLVDVKTLEKQCVQYLKELPGRAEYEANWLKKNRIFSVLMDMPLWAVQACRIADVPMLYCGNFTWTEQYREFLAERIWTAYAQEYEKIRFGLLYALHNKQMLEFLSSAELKETSVTARPFDKKRISELKSGNSKILFAALGMSASFTRDVFVKDDDLRVYATHRVPLTGDHVARLSEEVIDTQNYIAASDGVITKAGWGTVAECILARKPMALFSRDTVLEDRTTIALLEKMNLAIRITEDDLENISGIWEKLQNLNTSAFDLFYNASDEIAETLIELG